MLLEMQGPCIARFAKVPNIRLHTRATQLLYDAKLTIDEPPAVYTQRSHISIEKEGK